MNRPTHVCDDCQNWTDNVHAIALTLERLRLADLYGVTSRGEQYAGWRMLPGPITVHQGDKPAMSIEAAADFVARVDGLCTAATLISNAIQWRVAYRRVAARLHPDAGGSSADWSTLQDAARLMDALHGRK